MSTTPRWMRRSGSGSGTTGGARTESETLIDMLARVGRELGLFDDLDARGPATTPELATRTGLDEACVSEWLMAMATAGYIAHDPRTRRFELRA